MIGISCTHEIHVPAFDLGTTCRKYLAAVLARNAPDVGTRLMRPACPTAYRMASTPTESGRSLRITAVGEEAVRDLGLMWPEVVAAVETATQGGPLETRAVPAMVYARTTSRPIIYRIRQMVVSMKERHRARLHDPKALTCQVLADIERHAQFAGCVLSDGWEDRVYTIKAQTEIGSFAVPVHGGRVATGWREISLTAALQFRGPWQVGRLQSRGFGRIRRALL